MNSVMLLGNLATDVDVKVVAGDRKVAKFLLAVGRIGSKREKKPADFFRIVAWSKQAENAGRYLRKGSRVCVTGRLQGEFYEKPDGSETRLNTEVMADQIEYLSPPVTAAGGRKK